MVVLLAAFLAGILVFGRKQLFAAGAFGKAAYFLTGFVLIALVFLLVIERIEGMGENMQ